MGRKSFCVFFIFFLISLNVSAQSVIDSLINTRFGFDIAQQEELKRYIHLTNQISDYFVLANSDSSLKYAREALQLSESIGYEKGMGESAHFLSFIYLSQSKQDSALMYAKESKNAYQSIGDTLGLIRALNDESKAFLLKNNYDLALENYIELLPLVYDYEGESIMLARVQANIGYINMQIGDFDNAIFYYEEAIEIVKQLGSKSTQAVFLGNLARIYLDISELNKAEQYYRESLDISEEINDRSGVGVALYNLGKIDRLRGDLVSAEDKIKSSFEPLNDIGDKRLLANAHFQLGKLYEEKGDYGDAVLQLTRAKQNLQNIENYNLLTEILKSLSEVYQKRGNYLEALVTFDEYDSVRTLQFERDQSSKILSLNRKFDLTNKELEIELLESERELQQAKLEAEILWRNFFLIGSIFLAAILFLILNRYQTKKKSEQKLQEKNQSLEELNEQKNMFIRMAAHDLKSPLASISGLSELIKLDLEESNYSEVSDYAGNILLVSERMLEIIKNLLNVELIESDEKVIRPRPIELNPYIKKVIANYKYQAQQKQIDIHFKESLEELLVMADESSIDGILENLLSNAIKYSPSNSNVWIDVYSRESTNCVKIRDEGLGFTKEDKEQLFEKYKTLSSQPTAGEHSNGLGLYIVKNMIDQLNGNIDCESEKGKGTTFLIELPKPSNLN